MLMIKHKTVNGHNTAFFCNNRSKNICKYVYNLRFPQAKACGYYYPLITESGSIVAALQEGMIVATV